MCLYMYALMCGCTCDHIYLFITDIQTYVMAGLHRKIFKEVCFIVAQKVRSSCPPSLPPSTILHESVQVLYLSYYLILLRPIPILSVQHWNGPGDEMHQCMCYVSFLCLLQDATLNKITRNLSDTHPQYLGVRAQFR